MSSFVYLYSLYVHMFKLYLSVFVRLLSVFNVNCMHQGSESYAISILCMYSMCCTCGRIDNKADFDFEGMRCGPSTWYRQAQVLPVGTWEARVHPVSSSASMAPWSPVLHLGSLRVETQPFQIHH